MELPINHFKRWLSGTGPKPPIGTWLMSTSPTVAEAIGLCGFDFVVLDTEHSAVDAPQAGDILRAIDQSTTQTVVRLPWNDPIVVKRFLDLGAQTLMFPFIEDAQQAARAVASTRYPPAGTRGVAAIHRASRYGLVEGYAAKANAEIVVIAQIETPAALARIAEIAAVPGIDALFVGPGDLSTAMGHPGAVGHPEVQAALKAAAEAAHLRKKPIGTVGPNAEMVNKFIGYGYDFIAISSDMAMIIQRSKDLLSQVKG